MRWTRMAVFKEESLVRMNELKILNGDGFEGAARFAGFIRVGGGDQDVALAEKKGGLAAIGAGSAVLREGGIGAGEFLSPCEAEAEDKAGAGWQGAG